MEERSAEKRLWTLPRSSRQCLHIPTAIQTDWEDTLLQQSGPFCRVVPEQ